MEGSEISFEWSLGGWVRKLTLGYVGVCGGTHLQQVKWPWEVRVSGNIVKMKVPNKYKLTIKPGVARPLKS